MKRRFIYECENDHRFEVTIDTATIGSNNPRDEMPCIIADCTDDNANLVDEEIVAE